MIELSKLLGAIIKNWLLPIIFVATFIAANWGYKQLWAEPPVTTRAIGYYTLTLTDPSPAVDNEYLELKTTGEVINVLSGWLYARSDNSRPKPIKTSYQTFYVTAEFPHFESGDDYFRELTNDLQDQLDQVMNRGFALKLDNVEPISEPSAIIEWLTLAFTAIIAGIVWILIKEFVFKR